MLIDSFVLPWLSGYFPCECKTLWSKTMSWEEFVSAICLLFVPAPGAHSEFQVVVKQVTFWGSVWCLPWASFAPLLSQPGTWWETHLVLLLVLCLWCLLAELLTGLPVAETGFTTLCSNVIRFPDFLPTKLFTFSWQSYSVCSLPQIAFPSTTLAESSPFFFFFLC